MKIVHLCLGNFFIDGYSYQENMLTKHHALQGHDVTVIASTYSFDKDGNPCDVEPSIHTERGCKIIRIPYKGGLFHKLWKYIRVFDGVYNLLEQESPDIIFSHNVQYYDAFWVTKYMKKHPNVKLYCDNHGDFINSARNWASKWIKHKIMWRIPVQNLAKYATCCYGVTPMRCEFLKQMYGLPSEKVKFLTMGIDDEAIPRNREEVRTNIREQLGISDNAFVMCTGGKLELRKNTHHLLAALRKVIDPRVHLIVFGTSTPEIKGIVDQYRDDKNVHFVGWCNAEQVMNYMVASDFGVFPGTHSTLWEQCIGLGIPTIFKNWGEGFAHLYAYDNCHFVKGDDEVEITQAINSLIFTDRYYQLKSNTEKASKSFLYSEIARKSIENNW